MQALRINHPYPVGVPNGVHEALELRDGMATQPMPSGLHTLVHLSRFEPGDAEAFAGPLTLGVAMLRADVPWLALRLEANGLAFDGPILVGHRPDLRAHLGAAGNLLQLVVLEGNRYTVRHLRALGLAADVLGALKAASAQEAHVGRIQTIVLEGQRHWPASDDVMAASTVTQRFGR